MTSETAGTAERTSPPRSRGTPPTGTGMLHGQRRLVEADAKPCALGDGRYLEGLGQRPAVVGEHHVAAGHGQIRERRRGRAAGTGTAGSGSASTRSPAHLEQRQGGGRERTRGRRPTSLASNIGSDDRAGRRSERRARPGRPGDEPGRRRRSTRYQDSDDLLEQQQVADPDVRQDGHGVDRAGPRRQTIARHVVAVDGRRPDRQAAALVAPGMDPDLIRRGSVRSGLTVSNTRASRRAGSQARVRRGRDLADDRWPGGGRLCADARGASIRLANTRPARELSPRAETATWTSVQALRPSCIR